MIIKERLIGLNAILLLISLSLFLFFAKNNAYTNTQSNGKILIIDSSRLTNEKWVYDNHGQCGYYPIYYIGRDKDTITLCENIVRKRDDLPYHSYSIAEYFLLDRIKIRIVVDTIINLSHTFKYYHYDPQANGNGAMVLDSAKAIAAFPVFVYNESKFPIMVGEFNELGYTIRQAKDEQGNWVDIEVPIRYMCGTGAKDVILQDDQMLVAKLIRFGGDYRTECRLKYLKKDRIFYSNAFIDYIDKRQLTDSLCTGL